MNSPENIPEGRSGDWSVERRDGKTRLHRFKKTIMVDSPIERRHLNEFERRLKGDVLINGLGLGLAVSIALRQPKVKSIIVNEISEDVIKLVAPYYNNDRLMINEASAYEWKPSKDQKFDVVWHDISDSEQTILLHDIAKLYKRYARFLKEGGWQSSWETVILGIEMRELRDYN